jgi:hypothetical protein
MLILLLCFHLWQGLPRKEYEQKKELVANEIIRRLEKKLFPGLQDSIVLKEVYSVLPYWDSLDIFNYLILTALCLNLKVMASIPQIDKGA